MTQDPEEARRTLTALRTRLGVTAHLDDFGTGASSLRFLHRFPGDALKIDRGLVIDMLTDPGSHEIVKAIVGLAHNLGMEVVGEGVETAAHLERLQVLGCELAQGFHLARRSPPRRRRTCWRPRAAEHEPGGAAEAGVLSYSLRALGVADVVRDPLALEAALVLRAIVPCAGGALRVVDVAGRDVGSSRSCSLATSPSKRSRSESSIRS